ncbi:MAG: Flp pilus assembly protein CpaB [Planctomycetes bacterium]|nr:Flp pilus assembly protein CpaB [Planctomycetota bacterium]
MKNKSLMLLLVAAGCGLVAMIGVQQMLSGKPVTKTRILVARTDIEAGVRLDKTNIGFKEWPADAIPEGAIQSEEEFADRSLKHRVGPGQPILASELGNKGEYGLEIQIPAEMRVVTLPVTATMTHSGLLRPGNFVDISAVIEVPQKGGGKRMQSKPVLQCIQVFAVDSRIVGSEASKDPKASDVKNVSFLVYPLQGQLIQLANKQSNGNLQLALRSGSDKKLANVGDLNEDSLSVLARSLSGQEDEPEKVEAKVAVGAKPKSAFRSYLSPETSKAVTAVGEQAVRRTWRIEIFQGDQKEVQEIDWPEENADSRPTSGDEGQPWTNPLKFFERRQKTDKSAQTRSTSLIRRTDTVEDTLKDEPESTEPESTID